MAERSGRQFLDPKVVARLMHQPLGTRLPMIGNIAGLHRSPHRGSSVEFAEYRKYAPGDDVRRIDWRVYARSDRFFVKEFEADTNLRCYFLMDCSGSMGFKGQGDRKFDYSKRLIGTLAYMLIHQGDAAGLVCLADKVLYDIPPKRNPAHLQSLFDILDQLEPKSDTNLIKSLHDFAEKTRQRALVIIVSDFFCEVDPLLDCFQHLRFEKHDVVAFHLMDRMELDFPFDRPVRFVDLESPATLLSEPAVIRAQYLKAVKEHLSRLKDGCNRFGIEYRPISTDEDYENVLREFLRGRALKIR